MKINLNTKKSITFNSGISHANIKTLSKIEIADIDRYFSLKQKKTEPDFQKNSVIAILNFLCSETLNKLKPNKNFFRLDFASKPKHLQVFNKQDLQKPLPNYFCTACSSRILRNKATFKPVSIFLQTITSIWKI